MDGQHIVLDRARSLRIVVRLEELIGCETPLPHGGRSMSQAQSRRLVEASQTLGAAFLDGLRPHVRCLRGKRIGPVKVEPCGYYTELDLESLIWTRGAKYPCWRLAQRLKCPRCGGVAVELTWLMGSSTAARLARTLYQCLAAAGRNT